MSFRVFTGLENFDPPPSAKVRAGLVCNQASVDAGLRRAVDRLASSHGLDLRVLFGPEHGIYGVEQDMAPVQDTKDAALCLPVRSLYGCETSSLEPPVELLSECEVLLFDLQDVGSRYYTFVSTLIRCMRVCAKAGVGLIVLDRPNPIGGIAVEGNGVESGFKSFVGEHDFAVRHGMTIGELAMMVHAEENIGCELEVVRMTGWRRNMLFHETGLPWIATSPNMPTVRTAMVYPGMCLLEATNLSEGRGTTRPFELCGAPFIDPLALCRELNASGLAGVYFRPEYFKPQFHKFFGKVCGGFQVHVTDPTIFRPYLTGVAVLLTVRKMYADKFRWRTDAYEFVEDKPAIDLLAGTELVRRWIERERPLREFREFFEEGAAGFTKRREPHLLYR